MQPQTRGDSALAAALAANMFMVCPYHRNEAAAMLQAMKINGNTMPDLDARVLARVPRTDWGSSDTRALIGEGEV
jgi:hypothetical protein